MVMKRKANGQFMKGEHWREHKPFREKEWLIEHYVNQGLSAGDIAKMHGVTDAAIIFWLKKHGIKRRSVSQARALKKWGSTGEDNPMWNKRGELNPRWLGGVTPERQDFYTSRAWKDACSRVWKRDNATCQRCGAKKIDDNDTAFHIHHIHSFANKELRADVDNLVLLCEHCHRFVHSKRNIENAFLPKK